MMELDQEAMAAVFAAMQKANIPDDEYVRGQIARGIPPIGRTADLRRHQANRYRREVLRNLMGWWFGMQPPDRDMGEKYRRFYHRFGIDAATAMTLNAAESDALAVRIASLFTEDMT